MSHLVVAYRPDGVVEVSHPMADGSVARARRRGEDWFMVVDGREHPVSLLVAGDELESYVAALNEVAAEWAPPTLGRHLAMVPVGES